MREGTRFIDAEHSLRFELRNHKITPTGRGLLDTVILDTMPKKLPWFEYKDRTSLATWCRTTREELNNAIKEVGQEGKKFLHITEDADSGWIRIRIEFNRKFWRSDPILTPEQIIAVRKKMREPSDDKQDLLKNFPSWVFEDIDDVRLDEAVERIREVSGNPTDEASHATHETYDASEIPTARRESAIGSSGAVPSNAAAASDSPTRRLPIAIASKGTAAQPKAVYVYPLKVELSPAIVAGNVVTAENFKELVELYSQAGEDLFTLVRWFNDGHFYSGGGKNRERAWRKYCNTPAIAGVVREKLCDIHEREREGKKFPNKLGCIYRNLTDLGLVPKEC